MLQELIEEIERLRSSISDDGTSFENETSTRVSLVDPLLRILGWNPEDPRRVRLEYDVAGNKIDYALLQEDETPWAGIEAKKLGENLIAYRDKMVTDSILLGAPFYALTDGDNWQWYRGFRNKSEVDRVHEHRIFDVSIRDTHPFMSASSFARLWRPDFDRVPAVPSGRLLFWSTTDVPLSKGWTRLCRLPAPGPKPGALRFLDGTERSTKFWYQLVGYTAEWLASNKLLNASNVPVLSTDKKRCIVSSDAMNPTGKQYKKPMKIPHCNLRWDNSYGAAAAKCDALELLKHCDQDPSNVLVRVDS